MGKKKMLTAAEIAKIEAYLSEGYSMPKIAKKIGRNDKSVRNVLSNPATYGKNNKGRTKTPFTPHEKRKIIRIASNLTNSSIKIKQLAGVSASKSTVLRAFLSIQHLKFKKLKKKNLTLAARKEQRLEFAHLHMTWYAQVGSVLN